MSADLVSQTLLVDLKVLDDRELLLSYFDSARAVAERRYRPGTVVKWDVDAFETERTYVPRNQVDASDPHDTTPVWMAYLTIRGRITARPLEDSPERAAALERAAKALHDHTTGQLDSARPWEDESEQARVALTEMVRVVVDAYEAKGGSADARR